MAFVTWTNNSKEVLSPADMTDLKIRVMNNKVYIEMMKALGASPYSDFVW